MTEEAPKGQSLFSRIIRGIIKLILAPFIIGVVSNITIPDLSVGSTTVSGALIKALIEFAVPVYLIFSALHDFGVEM
jgi:hypothetical protein